MEQLLYQQIFSVSLVWFLFIIHFPTQSFQDYPLHKDCLMFRFTGVKMEQTVLFYRANEL
jgi:hypothetical protein